MDFEIRFKSIAVRWFVDIFLIVAAALTVVAVAFSIFFNSLYIERVETLANDYSLEFSSLKSANKYNFEDMAVSLASSFEYKDKIEVQIIGSSGKVVVSTTGFLPADEKIADYDRALSSAKKSYTFNGRNSGGERILANTTVLHSPDGDVIGAVRWVTSLKATYGKTAALTLIIVALCLLVLGLCLISGTFFIKSIVRPIRDVSNMARKIAMGDFESRIEFKKNDEIGELCDAINYMASELNQAETMKNDFISSVSHELRTPLTAIRGWGETAKMSVGTDEELVSQGLDVVLGEADRLSSLVEELLDFSRMQSGRLSFDMKALDISDLLKDAVDMYCELARKQGIELTYTAPKQKSPVMGDANRLKQVFINIIDNAVKYTEKGGLILVTEGREEGCVRITVKDTGLGIPAQDIDRVKEKFFKSNKTVRGSGIGLAVADEIIKQHQGLLFLESTEGVGTTVTIVLPLYEEPTVKDLPAEEIILTPEQIQTEE